MATVTQPGTHTPQALLLLLGPDPAMLTDLVTILSTRLYRTAIETCETASEGLERIQSTDYDVIISDAAVFGPQGLGVMEQIRQCRPHTPTILLTVPNDRPLTVRALAAGAYAVIIKPVDSDYLAASVKRAVQMRHLAKQVEEQKHALVRHANELERLVADRTQELQRKEREQQVIFNSVPAMIWYKDRYNRILRVNEPAAASIGLKVEEVEGKSTYDLYPDEAAQYHKDDLDVIASGKPKLGIIEPYQTGQGYKRWVRTDKVPYRDETGTVIGVIVFAVDITDCLDRFARRLGEKGSRRDPLQGQA
jgi:PAS domain S-box-containing protein